MMKDAKLSDPLMGGEILQTDNGDTKGYRSVVPQTPQASVQNHLQHLKNGRNLIPPKPTGNDRSN